MQCHTAPSHCLPYRSTGPISLRRPFLVRRNWPLLWNVSLTVIACTLLPRLIFQPTPSLPEDYRECGAHLLRPSFLPTSAIYLPGQTSTRRNSIDFILSLPPVVYPFTHLILCPALLAVDWLTRFSSQHSSTRQGLTPRRSHSRDESSISSVTRKLFSARPSNPVTATAFLLLV